MDSKQEKPHRYEPLIIWLVLLGVGALWYQFYQLYSVEDPDLSCYYQGQDGRSNPDADQNRAVPEDSNTNQNSATQSQRECPEAKAALEIADVESQISMARAAITQAIINLVGLGLLGFTVYFTWKAAKSTEKTLDIAQQTLRATSESSRKELRAYVALKDIRVEYCGRPPLFQEEPLKIYFALENSGITPATNVTCSFNGAYAYGDYVPQELYLQFKPLVRDFGTLAKDGAEKDSGGITLLQDDADKIRDLHGVLVMRFIVQYNDVFRRDIQSYITGALRISELFQEGYPLGERRKFKLRIIKEGTYESIIDPDPVLAVAIN